MTFQPDGRLDEAVDSVAAVRDGSRSAAVSSSAPSNPQREESPSSPHAHTSEPRDGGALTIYCHGRRTVARYLCDGWAHCWRCGDRIRVVA